MQEDLAEATAIALIDPERLIGIIPALTGAEALDIADIVSDLAGRKLARIAISDEEYLAKLVAAGTPKVTHAVR